MKLSEKEIIRKLAKAVLDNRLVCGDASGECFVCEQLAGTHKPDCPVLLAEEVLRDCEKCIHVGAENACNCINGDKYQIKCPVCNGFGGYDQSYTDGYIKRIKCDSCNGTGVKK